MILNLVIGLIVEPTIAVVGVVALVRASRCTRWRFAVRAAGVALVLHSLIAILWRVGSYVVYLGGSYDSASESSNDLMLLFDTLAPVHTITGSILLTTVVVLLLGALIVQARGENAPPPPPGAPGGGHYGAPPPYPQPHNHARGDISPNSPGEHPPTHGQSSPAREAGPPEQFPPPGTFPPGGKAR